MAKRKDDKTPNEDLESGQQNDADSDQSEDSVEKGPNGFPYADNDKTRVSRWKSGDYHIKLVRNDGERVDVNLRPAQMRALKKSIELATDNDENQEINR